MTVEQASAMQLGRGRIGFDESLAGEIVPFIFHRGRALGWAAYQALQRSGPGWQVGLDLLGGAAAIALGASG